MEAGHTDSYCWVYLVAHKHLMFMSYLNMGEGSMGCSEVLALGGGC